MEPLLGLVALSLMATFGAVGLCAIVYAVVAVWRRDRAWLDTLGRK